MGRHLKSLAIYALIGPLLGLTIITGSALIFGQAPPYVGTPNLLANFGRFIGFFIFIGIPISYLVGAVPALISGMMYRFTENFIRSKYIRLVLSIPIGAIQLHFWIAMFSHREINLYRGSTIAVELLGALVSLICAGLIELKRAPSTSEAMPQN